MKNALRPVFASIASSARRSHAPSKSMPAIAVRMSSPTASRPMRRNGPGSAKVFHLIDVGVLPDSPVHASVLRMPHLPELPPVRCDAASASNCRPCFEVRTPLPRRFAGEGAKTTWPNRIETGVRQSSQVELNRRRSERLAWLYLAAILAINFFVCRDAFHADGCSHMASWHGAWLSLARLAGLAWVRPTWWRYWGGGEPLSLSYAPLIPFSIAGVSRVVGCTREMALNAIAAFVYCAGPAALYMLSWRLTRRAGCSFAAALIWSLASPIAFLMPDAGPGHPLISDPRRLILLFAWDDLPRMTSLLFFPLAAWGLVRALERRRPQYYAAAGIGIAGMMLANTAGAILTALLVVTLPVAMNPRRPLALLRRSVFTAAVTYLAIAPWLPPSFFLTTHNNEVRNGEAQWTASSTLALALTLFVLWQVWRLFKDRLANWYARWLLFAGTPVVLIAAFQQYAGWHFLPQAWRFKIEAEVTIVWMVVFLMAEFLARIPRAASACLLAIALPIAGVQAVRFHRSEQALTAPIDRTRTIHYRLAQWVAANLPGERVMLGGTLGTFLDEFVTADEFSAEQFTSGPNFEQKIAVYTIYTGTNAGLRDAEYSLLWLRAFGVHAIGVPGPSSPEYWKPFSNPRKFDGVLKVLWKEDDTTLYQVPGSHWTAHVLPAAQLVRTAPVHGLDTAQLSAFVAAQDAAGGAMIVWDDANHARVRAQIQPQEVLATQMTYDPGWHATVNGSAATVRPDGIGLMVVETACVGPCDVRLEFDGGWEWRICLAASAVTLLGLAVLSLRRRVPMVSASFG